MCTQSWIHAEDGYELFFNRDEAISRAAENPARELERGGVRVLAPSDGESGGTWVSVNEHGLCVTLLNAYLPAPERDDYTTRGRLPLELAAQTTLATAADALTSTDLRGYRPFHVALVAPRSRALLFTWNGTDLSRDDAESRMPLASSGADQEIAKTRRSRHLLDLRAGKPITADLLARFHASHEDGPSAWSPCMHSERAETRSLCRVSVTEEYVRLTHTPGSPCRTEPLAPLSLKRRA